MPFVETIPGLNHQPLFLWIDLNLIWSCEEYVNLWWILVEPFKRTRSYDCHVTYCFEVVLC